MEFGSSQEAEKVLKSVELDNQGYVVTKLVGKTIHAEMQSPSLNSLLHTLDDFLACVNVAERVVSGKD